MERRIVTTCLVGCLTLGFLSLFSAYLPSQMLKAKGPLKVATLSVSESSSLSEIVDSLSSPPPPPEGKSALLIVTESEEAQPVEFQENFIEREKFSTEEPLYAGAKVRRAVKVSKVPVEVADQYPLRMYEPLTERLMPHLSPNFIVTPKLKAAFEFWRNVYGCYELNQTILHDSRHLNIVYGVLDFSDLNLNLVLSEEKKRFLRNGIEERKKEELAKMLLRFDQGEKPKTAGEHIVFGLVDRLHEPSKFKRASERIRSQWGQKDRFQAGLVRAGRYLPMMEEIFVREGLPKEMTRLVFVESMFTLRAVSKSGAVGPWQFMPGTAKNYMTMNFYVDERLDPLIAAQAASRLLKKNYDHVRSWPLAINGYNTGILRMVKAMNRLQTHDIGIIIEQFQDPGYQFASRNFYPEFLAALDVVNHYPEYFGKLKLDSPIPFDEIALPYNTSLYELAESTGIDLGVLMDLNPAYHEKNFLKHRLIPKGYTLRLPFQQKMIFLAALDQIQAREGEIKWHIVSKGENLKQIAALHQIPTTLLKETNGLVGNKLRAGQILKIPGKPSKVVLETH